MLQNPWEGIALFSSLFAGETLDLESDYGKGGIDGRRSIPT